MAKSSEKFIYKITLRNWLKHNSNHKDFYKKTPISNNFCNDPLLQQLPITARWMYLGLLLSAGDHNDQCITITSAALQQLSSKGVPYTKLLLLLEQYQLLTVIKYPSLEVFNKEFNKEINNKESEEKETPPKQPAKEFSNISNSTEIHHTALSKNQELSEIESTLRSENVLGNDIPPAIKSKKSMTSFCSRILISYAMSVEDFKRDLKSVINESLVDKIAPSGKSDYIVARIKKKALEVYNAAQ